MMESYQQEFINYCQKFSFIYQEKGKWVGLTQPFNEKYSPMFQFITKPLASKEDAWQRIQTVLIEVFLIEELCNQNSGIIAFKENSTIINTSKNINNKYGDLNDKDINEILNILPSQAVIESIFDGYFILKIDGDI